MLPYAVLIHHSSLPKHPSKSDYSRDKPQMIGMKTWNWLQVEVIACGIYWSELEKEWNLQGWSTKKPHDFGVLSFGLGIFKGDNTLLWNHTCYDLLFFQNFQQKWRNFSGVFTKAFPQPLFLFLFSGTDHCLTNRPSVLGAEILYLLHWPRTSSWTSPK